jgi:DNA sulfur modification protein DndC
VPTVDELIAQHGAALAFVVNMSGGKDSVRMLGKIRKLYPNQKTYVVYADTGFEHVKPVSAEDWARARTEQFGLGLDVVRNPNKTYLQMVENRGKFPGPQQRQCTSDLKNGPIAKYIRHLPERILINCTGIRAAESPQRAKQNPWTLNTDLSIEERRTKEGRVFQQARVVWNWMPIFEEGLWEVIRWHWSNQVPLHPVYGPEYHCDGTKGGYLRRFSCRVCIFSTDADIRAIHTNDPDAFYAVANLEQRIGFTMKNGVSLFQIIESAPTSNKQFGSEEVSQPCLLW